MAERVFLHLGGPKCGTTYLQTVLWHNQQRLSDAGFLVPGARMFHHNLAATWARTPNPRRRVREVWRSMLDQVAAHDGTAIYSNEWFTMADREGADRTLAAFAGTEVHLVVTARDPVGLVPGAWQEVLKLGHGGSLDDFVTTLDEPGRRWCWETLDPAEVLSRWDVAPERVHVVTLPAVRGGTSELWDRFSRAVGVPAGVCDLDTARPNESVDVVSARLLQDLGPRLRDAIDADSSRWQEQYRWLRRYVSHELLVPRQGPTIALGDQRWHDVRQRAMASVERLREAGYRVEGDLDDLTAREPDPRAVRPEEVSEAELLEVSNDLVVALLRQLRAATDDDAPLPGTL